MRASNTLILFSKSPRICRVKTRMQPNLSHRECLYLHKMLTKNIIDKLSLNTNLNFVLYTTHPYTDKYLYSRNLRIKKQQGINLGMRMHNAISEELKYSQKVVLIGSDCLEFTPGVIQSAFEKLNKARDIVIGPTDDGGYLLVGMRKQNKFLFKNISWSSSSTLDMTIKAARNFKKNISILDKMRDLDSIEDLRYLSQQITLPNWAQQLTS